MSTKNYPAIPFKEDDRTLRAFEFYGGCPELIIPDNLRSGMNRRPRKDGRAPQRRGNAAPAAVGGATSRTAAPCFPEPGGVDGGPCCCRDGRCLVHDR